MIEEAYDCAKIFNTSVSGQQMPLQSLCDTYLNLAYKKKTGPAYAVSNPNVANECFVVHRSQDLNGSIQTVARANRQTDH